MARIIALILFLLLVPTYKTAANDAVLGFQIMVKTGEQITPFDGSNKTSIELPISDGLSKEGWSCILTPRSIINGELGQAVMCQNDVIGALITSIIKCKITINNSEDSNFILDSQNPNVRETIFALQCNSRVGQTI